MASRRRFLEGCVTAACAALAAPAEGQTAPDISQTLTAYVNAKQKGDLVALSQFYSDQADGRLANTGEFRLGGKSIESDLLRSTPSFRWTVDEIQFVGDGIAFVDVSYVDGFKTGRASYVWVRQGNRLLIRVVRIAPGPDVQR
jgi:hypothetical protein